MTKHETEYIVNIGDEFDANYLLKKQQINKVKWILFAVFTLIGLILYVSLCSVYPQYWKSFWVFLLLGFVVSSGYISYMKARMVYFNYPFALLMFYIPISFEYDLFLPMLGIFFSLLVFYPVGMLVDSIIRIKK